MKILKAFNKILGGILFGFFVIFVVCFYLGALGVSIYIMLMSWVPMPGAILDLPLEMKVFTTSLGVILFFAILTCLYFSIETTVNPPYYAMPPLPSSLRPKPPKTENKPKKPILG